MSNKTKQTERRKGALQLRVPCDKRGLELADRIEKIAETNGLSINDVANMCMAAGLPMVQTKLREIHEPDPMQKAA